MNIPETIEAMRTCADALERVHTLLEDDSKADGTMWQQYIAEKADKDKINGKA